VIAAVVVYAVVLLGFGLSEFKKIGNFDDFVVSGRKQGAGSITYSILATCIGASATLGVVSTACTIGFPAFWWLGAGALGLLCQSFFLSQKVREVGAYTLPDLSERLIGKEARFLTSVVVVIAWIGIIAAQFVAGAKLLSLFGGITPFYSILITAAVIIFYSILGGQPSIIKTDKIQFAVLGGALLYTFIFLFTSEAIPLESVRFDIVNSSFTAKDLLYYLFIIGGSYFVCPLLFSRLLSSTSPQKAQKASLFSALGLLIISLVITFIGIWASFYIEQSYTGDVLGYLIKEKLPTPGGLVLLLGLFSAIISSADTCLFAVASIVEYDLLKKKRIANTRLVIGIVGMVSALLATKNPDIISLLIQAYGVFTAGIVPPIAISLIMWKKRKIHPYWGVGAIVCGGVLGVAANLTAVDMVALVGMALSTGFSLIGLYIPQKKLPHVLGENLG
jgi:solute:Na+ symporter, SSS family